MKAMIFAAGLGTRLRPLTNDTPKCLVEIAPKVTLLDAVVERLKRAGVGEVVLNLHHFPGQIKTHVAARGNYDIAVHFSYEESLLDTGGGLRHAADWFRGEDAFFIHNSDVYTELDLTEMLTKHQSAGALATLAVSQRERSRYLLFDEKQHLAGWEDQRQGAPPVSLLTGKRLAFNGIHVVSGKFLKYLEAESGAFSIIAAYLKAAGAGEIIQAFPMDDYFWMDVGTVENLERLKAYLLEHESPI
ncbi:MAG: nucleotidyltransferase family protein [Candidatus Marinimicrobia bacterium]|nr:nucleotidyltransferase family protein [Candidatus Neomarinimicrobiota bacterium]